MSNPQQLQCRMYEAKYPEVDDLVMVNVRQIAEMGAYVKLLEYDSIEGMILLSELSRRRIRSIQKLIRVGRNEVVVVLRVDKEKGNDFDSFRTVLLMLRINCLPIELNVLAGYIDLSKRRVSPEDVAKAEEKFNKSKAVHSIMRHVAEKQGVVLEELYKQVGWPLYKKYGHAYEAFKLAITEPEKVFEDAVISKEVMDELLANIKRRLTPQPIKIRADLDVTCFGYDGIDAIKVALKAGEACRTDDIQIKIKLVAPPLYVMITNALDKNLGIEVLEKAIVKIQETIQKVGGDCIVKMKPRAVSETDDIELEELMARVEKENLEVSGDEDTDAEVEDE
ncbi:469_t:CDS:2 [Paraglomus brasilianum]|uniref:Eukaryotic translation initiation factor 2 subunit alpha n=1 Tax=Paraglomus brasilianum TaxID=144538 RepID=A0A9N9G4J9_9GLOM|nr:469_t:CDS:2 [Paraglomus brasilianum]